MLNCRTTDDGNTMTDELHPLRTVGLEFLDAATVRFDYEATLPARVERVFAAISADPTTWTWFPGLADARYDSAPPHGVGTKRSVVMNGTRYRETILAWDPPVRWAYRVDESSDATFTALAEDWLIEPDANGAVLRWRFAVDPQPNLVELIAGAREMIGGVWSEAMDGLGAHLRAES